MRIPKTNVMGYGSSRMEKALVLNLNSSKLGLWSIGEMTLSVVPDNSLRQVSVLQREGGF